MEGMTQESEKYLHLDKHNRKDNTQGYTTKPALNNLL